MVRKSLIVAALVAFSSPLAAQEEWVWSADRPDGAAPAGVLGVRTLETGELHLEYRWVQNNYQGVWFGKDSLDLSTTLQLFEVAPLSLSDIRHTAQVSYGVSDNLTLRARGEFAFIEREQLRDDGTYYITSTSALGDVYADLTYNVIRSGPYRLDVNAGAIIPLGKSTTYAVSPYSQPAEEATPYDMRPGAGSFGIYGSVSADAQNEFGSVGAQFKMRTYVNENSRDFTLGDRYEANGWAAYVLNEHFSISAGVRWEKWARIDGSDPFLGSVPMRDPMNDGLFLGGIRASMPLGLNFVGPMGSVIAGHRVSFETVYALHHDYEGPQIGLDWGLILGYSVPF
jgi:hypothetical protein